MTTVANTESTNNSRCLRWSTGTLCDVAGSGRVGEAVSSGVLEVDGYWVNENKDRGGVVNARKRASIWASEPGLVKWAHFSTCWGSGDFVEEDGLSSLTLSSGSEESGACRGWGCWEPPTGRFDDGGSTVRTIKKVISWTSPSASLIVFKGLVWSGHWVPQGMDQDWDWSTFFLDLPKTGLDCKRPKTIVFCSLWTSLGLNWSWLL